MGVDNITSASTVASTVKNLVNPVAPNSVWVQILTAFDSLDPNIKNTIFLIFIVIIVGVGVLFAFSLMMVVKFALNAFEETRTDKPKYVEPEEETLQIVRSEVVNIPEEVIDFSHLEEFEVVEIPRPTMAAPQKHDMNLVIELNTYNSRKSQLEKFIWAARAECHKRVINYFKDELDLVREELASKVLSLIAEKMNGSLDDARFHNDFVTFKLVSKTTRSAIIENVADYFEKGFSQNESEDEIARRRIDLLKNIFIQNFVSSNIRGQYLSSVALHGIVHGMTDDLVRVMKGVVGFHNREHAELRKIVDANESEINRAYDKIIARIEELQAVKY